MDTVQTLSYSALERLRIPRPVDRLGYLRETARARKVLDLGALDETAYQAKQTTSHWLHAVLCGVADSVLGVDNSPLVPADGLLTAPNGRIISADIFELTSVVEQYGVPDVVIAGELIEHLPDTSAFLRSLKQSARLKGVKLVVTTPNACCWHNLLIGLASRESMHKDHLHVYSYKTLRTIFQRSGFQIQRLTPYKARFPEMVRSSGPAGSLVVRAFQSAVNALEFITPALSGGWIVETEI